MGEITINPIHNIHKKYRTMNLVNPYIFAPPVDLSTNTEIGGVAATINTPALLADRLRIDVSRITNFSTVGSDIKCNITGGTYAMNRIAFFNDTSVTYFLDKSSLITSLSDQTFSGAVNFSVFVAQGITVIGPRNFQNTKLSLLYFPNLTSASDFAFNDIQNKIYAYIPNCTTLGSNVSTNESVFFNIREGSYIYANLTLATINAGGVEADLVAATTAGAVVRYVSSYAAPNPVTTLASGTIYSTFVQLNFTPPSSTNAIDYYECYANGVFKNRITGSGQYIIGLTPNTFYNITLKAVDIFYNKSIVSNTVSQSTNGVNPAVPTTGLVSYYKLDSNSNDSFGTNNGADTSVSYVSGKIGNAGNFNGTTSNILIPYNSNLSFTNGSNDLPFSINAMVSFTATGNVFILGKTNGTNRLWEIILESGFLIFRLSSNNNVANRIERYVSFTPTLNAYYHITVTYDGSKTATGMKLYINNVASGSTRTIGTTYLGLSTATDSVIVGKFTSLTTYTLNGKIDELSIYNIELTQTEIYLLYNSGAGTTL